MLILMLMLMAVAARFDLRSGVVLVHPGPRSRTPCVRPRRDAVLMKAHPKLRSGGSLVSDF